jgi:hypothetical protein
MSDELANVDGIPGLEYVVATFPGLCHVADVPTERRPFHGRSLDHNS